MAQLKERLAAAEDNARLREERHLEQKTSLQDALSKEQAQHKATREDLQKRLEQISAEANARTEELKSERDKVNSLLTRLESQENALAAERQQHQATRETLQQRLEQAVADAQARGELALERDRVSSLTARLESQEKASRSNWCEWAVK
jgi:chromosome segregation ATPase